MKAEVMDRGLDHLARELGDAPRAQLDERAGGTNENGDLLVGLRAVNTQLVEDVLAARQVAEMAEERLQESEARCKRMEEQLVRAQRLVGDGQKLGQLAHDLSNLLLPLAAYPGLIESRLPEGHPALPLCGAMMAASVQIGATIEDLRTLNRGVHLTHQPADVGLLQEQATGHLPARDVSAIGQPEVDMCGRGEAILVVDDGLMQRNAVQRILETLGYRVTTAGSGEEAIACVERQPVDLMVLDIAMPGMDGFETYRRVLQVRPDQPAIILSGLANSTLVDEAQALGAGCLIAKPITVERIAQAIRAELDRRC